MCTKMIKKTFSKNSPTGWHKLWPPTRLLRNKLTTLFGLPFTVRFSVLLNIYRATPLANCGLRVESTSHIKIQKLSHRTKDTLLYQVSQGLWEVHRLGTSVLVCQLRASGPPCRLSCYFVRGPPPTWLWPYAAPVLESRTLSQLNALSTRLLRGLNCFRV